MLERVLVSFRRVTKGDTNPWAMFVRGSDEDKRSLREVIYCLKKLKVTVKKLI